MYIDKEDIKSEKKYNYYGKDIKNLYMNVDFFVSNWHYNPYNGHEVTCDCENCQEWENKPNYCDDEDMGWAIQRLLNPILKEE